VVVLGVGEDGVAVMAAVDDVEGSVGQLEAAGQAAISGG
jgi:hypothetical protein